MGQFLFNPQLCAKLNLNTLLRRVLGQGPVTLMNEHELQGSYTGNARASPGPGESRDRARSGRFYIGVYNPDAHVGGQRPVASLRPTV